MGVTPLSLLHHIVVFKRPLLRLLDGLLYFGPTFAHNCGQAAVSDSINLHLIVGYPLTISKVIIRQRFSIVFISCDWAGTVSFLVVFWHYQLVTRLARCHRYL